MTPDDLLDQYYLFAAEGAPLSAFVDAVLGGAYGPWNREALFAFLDRLEAILLANIASHGEELGPDRPDPAQVAADTRDLIEEARRRILSA
ncbi:MAG: hypothetical protein OWU84_10210 [Firmicutes bacterium]|nr:hypothetical protein [Bacillota bacterium]